MHEKKSVLEELGLYYMEVSQSGKIRTISRRLLANLGYRQASFKHLSDILSENSTFDILGYLNDGFPLHLYRANLRAVDNTLRPFQISSSSLQTDAESGKRFFRMIYQPMPEEDLNQGFFNLNVKARKLIRKYIPEELVQRARAAAARDLDHIPNEEAVLTFLFADLVSFTQYSEQRSPDEIVDMLNLSIGATSSTIVYWGGYVDKIMGDSIFAVFSDPLKAVIAAIEMQKQFQLLNLFNVKEDSDDIQLRIGINTGSCILSSIGTDHFLEWTVIGDSVNIAARLEKGALPGTILISQSTASPIKDSIEIIRQVEIDAKGKVLPLTGYYVNRANFEGPRGKMSLGLDDDLF